MKTTILKTVTQSIMLIVLILSITVLTNKTIIKNIKAVWKAEAYKTNYNSIINIIHN